MLKEFSLENLFRWTEEDIYEFDFKSKGVEFSVVKRLKEAVADTIKHAMPVEKKAGVHIGRIWFDPAVAPLGRGSSGTIVFAGLVEGREAAVKRLDAGLWTLAVKEIEAFQAGRSDECKHVVSYFGHEKDDGYIYLAISKCATTLGNCVETGSDLSCQLERVDERLRVLHELAQGIAHLHSLGVIHRDLTPSNVLLDDEGVVKISDMGLARKIIDGQGHVSTTSQGTIGWQPAEVLEKQAQSEKVDVFSFGCLCFYVLTLGKHPFGKSEEWQLRISKDRADFSPLHKLQGVLQCRQHPLRKYGSKYDLQQHFLTTSHEIPSFLDIRSCLACSKELLNDVERDQHDCDVVPHVMFCAEELLLRCLSHDAAARPLMDCVLNHPLFWSCDRRIKFLEIVSDWLKANVGLQSKIDLMVHTIYTTDGWQSYPGVKELLIGKYERTLSQLIRLVRNIAHHYHEVSEPGNQFRCLEDVADFFEKRFPQLLITVWAVIRDMPERKLCFDLNTFFV